MNKEEILSRSKKDNMFFDEYEKHMKFKGRALGLTFTLLMCIVIYVIKLFNKENCTDILTVIWSVLVGSVGYEAYLTKSKVKIVLSVFFLIFMLYYFIKFVMVVL